VNVMRDGVARTSRSHAVASFVLISQIGGTASSLGTVPSWTIDRIATCPSTNVELATRASTGRAKPNYALIADSQTAGRGRGSRVWVTPPGTALTMSVLMNPGIPERALGPLPLFVGLAVRRVLVNFGYKAVLKWPNDILLATADAPISQLGEFRKVGGILCQMIPSIGVIIGIGINMTQTAEQLPVEQATSLALAGIGDPPTVDDLSDSLISELDLVISNWEDDGPAALLAEYRAVCHSLHREVTISDPHTDEADGRTIHGYATGISRRGALLLDVGAGDRVECLFGDLHYAESPLDEPKARAGQ